MKYLVITCHLFAGCQLPLLKDLAGTEAAFASLKGELWRKYKQFYWWQNHRPVMNRMISC